MLCIQAQRFIYFSILFLFLFEIAPTYIIVLMFFSLLSLVNDKFYAYTMTRSRAYLFGQRDSVYLPIVCSVRLSLQYSRFIFRTLKILRMKVDDLKSMRYAKLIHNQIVNLSIDKVQGAIWLLFLIVSFEHPNHGSNNSKDPFICK